MTFYLNKDQFKEIKTAYDAAAATSSGYDEVYDIISTAMKEFGNAGANGDNGVLHPDHSMDWKVATWFQAATQVNGGEGGVYDFIRPYTLAQIEIRNGEAYGTEAYEPNSLSQFKLPLVPKTLTTDSS